MSKWQPIETAPKDGTVILAWFNGAEPEHVIVRYVGGYRNDPWAWGVTHCTTGEYNKKFITHWMPLPESPK